jgi:hypothetical protein
MQERTARRWTERPCRQTHLCGNDLAVALKQQDVAVHREVAAFPKQNNADQQVRVAESFIAFQVRRSKAAKPEMRRHHRKGIELRHQEAVRLRLVPVGTEPRI